MRGVAAVKPGATTGDIGARHPDLCRARALLGGARLLRPRARARCSTTSPTSCITASAGEGVAAEARHVLHHRADDQSRQAAA